MKDYHILQTTPMFSRRKARPGCGIDSLKKLMDESSIERAVCFAPFPSQYKEYNMPGDCMAGSRAQRMTTLSSASEL